ESLSEAPLLLVVTLQPAALSDTDLGGEIEETTPPGGLSGPESVADATRAAAVGGDEEEPIASVLALADNARDPLPVPDDSWRQPGFYQPTEDSLPESPLPQQNVEKPSDEMLAAGWDAGQAASPPPQQAHVADSPARENAGSGETTFG